MVGRAWEVGGVCNLTVNIVYWGLGFRDYYSILGLYWDNGKENGNYGDYSGSIRFIQGL